MDAITMDTINQFNPILPGEMKITLHQFRVSLILATALLFSGCSKTVVYQRPDQNISPLKTEARIIRLHEDFIYAEREGLVLKQKLIKKIGELMSAQKRFNYEFIPSGTEVPRNSTNNPSIFLIGDIWFNKDRLSGSTVQKVTRNRSGFGFSESWDELERSIWEEDVLQTTISLYFVEVGSQTKVLRATITVSNDKDKQVRSGGIKFSNSRTNGFFRDHELEPGYQLIEAGTNLSGTDQALDELATNAVKAHFNNL